jgi:hypothetical protein
MDPFWREPRRMHLVEETDAEGDMTGKRDAQ